MSNLLIFFHGDFEINSIIGFTGTFPNRTFSIKGHLKEENYKNNEINIGDIIYDSNWCKYEIKGLTNINGPIFDRIIQCHERENGFTGSINTGLGFIIRPQTFSDLIIDNKKKQRKLNNICTKNYFAATNNCQIADNTSLATIISCHNAINDVDESLMVNEICAMGNSIISDENLKKDISECPTGTAAELFPKILSLKTHQYRFKTDDDNAPIRRGFIAQNVQNIFPEIVKTNFRRRHPVRKNDNNEWVDNSNNIIDTEIHTIVVDENYSDIGFYYTTENRNHICIDNSALMEKIWITIQKLIEENNTLKSRLTILESYH